MATRTEKVSDKVTKKMFVRHKKLESQTGRELWNQNPQNFK